MKSLSHIYIVIIWTCLAGLVFTCKNPPKKHFNVSFYFWKQNLKLSKLEKETLKELRVKSLYVKFFDVKYDDLSQSPKPVADIKISEKLEQEIIPCIFIANDIWYRAGDQYADTLAKYIYNRIELLATQNSIQYKEIHLDCDWTPKTKAEFFQLIIALQKCCPKLITSTLRLYQLKHPETMGVPPTSAAALMCYNMKPPQDPKAANSIFESGELKKYTQNIKSYPLKLSIALPLYSWVCVFRNDIFQGLINNVSSLEIENDSFFKKMDKDRYKCQKTTNFKGTVISKGDILRLETSAVKELQDGLDFITQKLEKDTIDLIFYHLDESILQQYEKTILPILHHQ